LAVQSSFVLLLVDQTTTATKNKLYVIERH